MAAALGLVRTLCGLPLRGAKHVTRWLGREVKQSVGKRSPVIAWTAAATAVILGTGNKSLLVISGATGMPAVVTAFLTDITAGVALLLIIRPNPRKLEWPVVRVGLLFGLSSAVSIWSGQEALHHMPIAMYAVLALIIGPTTAALVSGRRNWQILGWVCVSAMGALLLYGVAFKELPLMGAVSILLNGAMYWVMLATFTGLGKMEQGRTKDAVFMASAVSKVVTVPILGVVFLWADGPAVVSQTSVWATLGALGVGAMASISAVLMSAGWKRGLTASAQAQLQPAKPVLALMWGLVAGQKPSDTGLNTIVGYVLVVLGAGAVGRIFVEEKRRKEAPDQDGGRKEAGAEKALV
ncbi:hypothetical protein E1281_13570 [Actinomadura sp. KC345]|uniref:hypothetical protein n=1 Tax=Actinomadura sp. KC345 TaxID=2530371 RepID=UPI001051C747|nr:hypothetical protein [Actinomadura sp. KC345]TDC55247.1 hypothetical protein E1281_13570 [Actinomadura sp. KC345]